MELALSLGHTNNASMGFSVALPHHTRASSDPPLQLHHLLPSTPVLPSPRLPIPCLSHALGMEDTPVRALDDTEDGAALSSPNSSAVSSFQMELYRNSRKFFEGDSEEDENGSTRKKLRLSKTQSAFLEDSFKEHTTLNPKQKLVLAKELNLRPRQVEVWFQNRRARTKLKQTEVDCEYLKRCCESLSEENKRLQKELQELRAFKTCEPFFMQLPATTLTMCPSCERVATTTSAAASATNNDSVYLNKPRILSGPHDPLECFF
ncbi:homeobox-leucine zipper protein HAT14 [Vigna radiata var. radiata]|uniref:Homeobox-leucine zipper protein HAT14 n=1 Tax=Vigna radiata var. radiata TaxID=3916 RepID=A0A1S3TPD0_VIGRR|nr:homeobox-leucine zipper protein HAT14 [Vigna radiata var. radiata]XP_022634669.1 homeobox-leucine zipper protein HAT14 [Vigna radiata var. radiata]